MSLPYRFSVEDIVAAGRTTYKDIEECRRWIETTDLPSIGDQQITVFLLANNNNQANTTKTIMAFFKQRRAALELFSNRDIELEELKKMTDIIDLVIIPKRMDDGRAIILIRLRDFSTANYDGTVVSKILLMAIDVLLIENPPTGLIFMVDMRGSSWMHLIKTNIRSLMRLSRYFAEGLPVTLSITYVLNPTYVLDKMLTFMIPFLRRELLETLVRYNTSNNMERFFENYLPAACMPSDYGGDLPPVRTLHETTMTMLRKYKHFFDADEALIIGLG